MGSTEIDGVLCFVSINQKLGGARTKKCVWCFTVDPGAGTVYTEYMFKSILSVKNRKIR